MAAPATRVTKKALQGGYSSASNLTATVFGSTGFLGKYVVSALGARGARLKLPVRCGEVYTRDLRVMADLGGVDFRRGSIRSLDHIADAVEGSQIVINLLGRTQTGETRRWSFEDVHTHFPAVLAELCAEHKVEQLIHVSGLGASTDAPSAWARSKALGEAQVLEAFPQATIVRPATLYGEEDAYLNRLAHFSRHFPFVPLLDGGLAKTQPTYVLDVANAIFALIGNVEAPGKVYELGGPKVYTHAELANYVARVIGDTPPGLSVPRPVALAAAMGLQLVPNPWVTVDQLVHEASDVLVSPMALGYADLGIKTADLEETAARWLHMYKKKSGFIEDGVVIREPQ